MIRCLLGMVAVFLIVTPSDAQEIMGVDEIQPGMIGETWTVMRGTQIERIKTEILGVSKNGLAPGYDLIIGKLVDERTSLTGAVHGMSGSPLYIDGKLVGALSRRIAQFEKDGHCGFTPIKDMLEVREIDLKQESKILPRGDYRQSSLSLPMGITGAPELPARLRDKIFGGMGETYFAGQSNAGSVDDRGFPMKPGSPVAAVLMYGDIQVAATGTITWTEGDQLLGFGHAMTGLGPVRLPMASAEIISVVPSYAKPFKIASLGRLRGSLSQDRFSAVYGDVGQDVPMAAYRIKKKFGENEKHYGGYFVKDMRLAPQMVSLVLASALMDAQSSDEQFTLDFHGQLKFKGLPPIVMKDVWSGFSQERMMGSIFEMIDLLGMMGKFRKRLEIESFEIDVEERPEGELWRIGSAGLDNPVEAMESGKAKGWVSVESSRGIREIKTFEIELPEEIRRGGGVLRISTGLQNQLMRLLRRGADEGMTPGHFIKHMNKRVSSNTMIVEVGRPGRIFLQQGEEVGALPLSASLTLAEPQETFEELVVFSRKLVVLDGSVYGSHSIELKAP